MKTKLTFEFIVDEKVLEESHELNEFDDILLRPLKDAGYEVRPILHLRKDTDFVYEISKGKLSSECKHVWNYGSTGPTSCIKCEKSLVNLTE